MGLPELVVWRNHQGFVFAKSKSQLIYLLFHQTGTSTGPNGKRRRRVGKKKGGKELVSNGDSFFRKKAVFSIVEHEFGKFSKYRK